MATSIFAGFVIFSFIGFIAHDLNTTIDKVVQQGKVKVTVTLRVNEFTVNYPR